MSAATIIATPTQIKYVGTNGFLVLNARDENEKFVTLVGNYNTDEFSSEKGFLNRKFSFFGSFKQTNYGEQFAFDAYSVIYENQEDEIFYFLSRMVNGLSEDNAKNIVQAFGSNTANIIEHHPNMLTKVNGIKEKKKKNIIEAWKNKKHLADIIGFLAPYGVSNTTIQKIFQVFKEQSIVKIKSNPYILTKIKGFGFKRADEIALKMGYAKNSINRTKAAILYCMQDKVERAGDTFVEKIMLFDYVKEALGIDTWNDNLPLLEAFTDLLQEGELCIHIYENTECVFLSYTYHKESYIHRILFAQKERCVEICSIQEAEIFLRGFESKHNIILSDEQREAVISAQKGNRIIAITGAAGTGKTSVSKAILKLFEKKYPYGKIRCCALSGVAAARVRKQSGYQASTIHTLLGYDPIKQGFIHNENNPIDANVILLDEASMVDISIFFSLLKAIDFSETHLIMLGDSAQLPPIGCGEIFNDVLSFNVAKTIILTKIFRQSEDNVLTTMANEVRLGRVPYYKENKKDFFFAKIDIQNYWYKRKHLNQAEYRNERDGIQTQILHYLGRCFEKAKESTEKQFDKQTRDYADLWDKLSHVQIITPQKEGILGVKNLNKMAQGIFNPQTPNGISFQTQEYNFSKGDKVIHLVNQDMDVIEGEDERGIKRVFNGQIGIIESINLDDDEIIVIYPNECLRAIYCKKHFVREEITLAYAISVHKSQGSEFANVFIPMTMNHAGMLNSNLIYTAMTRAKKQVIFAGETYAFEMGCKRKNEIVRKTLFKIIS